MVLSSCAGSNLPAEYIYEAPAPIKCTRAKILSQNPVKVGAFEDTPCPEAVVGFHIDDVGPIFNWIRSLQKTKK